MPNSRFAMTSTVNDGGMSPTLTPMVIRMNTTAVNIATPR